MLNKKYMKYLMGGFGLVRVHIQRLGTRCRPAYNFENLPKARQVQNFDPHHCIPS